MDSIATARDFFINQQGLSPNQAEEIISRGMEAYNERIQPQSMMQMASNGGRIGFAEGGLSEYELLKLKELGYNVKKEGTESFGGISVLKDILKVNKLAGGGIARLGYQLGGLSTMPMDFGQSLQVPQQQPQPNFSSATNITMNPLANYGQPELGQAGGTPLMMRGGGIARLGYQMGGEAGMNEMAMPQMNEQQALETIIQLLIEQGIDPETALQLAAQILQIFAQGGEPAVEAFANQLEQQEQVQEMARGGIAGLYPRQGYFVGKIVRSVGKAVSGVVKGVASAVKSVAKSPIGRMALTIGANMLLPGAGTAFGAALQSAAVNLGLQAIGGGKINPLEALAAGASGYIGYSGAPVSSATSAANAGYGTSSLGEFGTAYNAAGIANPNIGYGLDKFGEFGAPTTTSITATPNTGILQTLQDKATGFFKSPLDTVKSLGTSALDYAKKEPGTALAIAGGVGLAGGLGLGSLAGPKREDESDDEYAQRLQKASPYLRQYYANLNPGATPAQIEQFVAANTAEYRADGGIIGYANGGITRSGYKGAGMVSPRSNPTQQDELNQAALDVFKRPLHQLTPEEVDMLIEFIKEKFGKAPMQQDTTFAARGGSMVPPARQIEGGIIELDARKTGGYIPYGKKERVDDVPAMLAKDEFVFTSRAVKAAGDGSAKRGAAKMYKLMKQLEAKGMKMERGARA